MIKNFILKKKRYSARQVSSIIYDVVEQTDMKDYNHIKVTIKNG